MIRYVCDECQAGIDPADFHTGRALLVGDREAYCPACNPRRPSRPAPGRGRTVASHVPPRRDGLFWAGLIALVVVLPALTALLTYKLTVRNPAAGDARGAAPGGVDSELARQLSGLQASGARLDERLDEISRELAETRRRASTEPERPVAGTLELSSRLEDLDRTIARLESSLVNRMDGTTAPSPTPAAPAAQAPPVDVAPPAPVAVATVEGFPADPRAQVGALLDALALGVIPPGADLGTLVDSEDATVRMLACKVAGIAGSDKDATTLDRAILKRLMRHMRDPDDGAQQAALAAVSAITGERYRAWDDMSAEDYAQMARARQLWADLERNRTANGDAGENE